MGKIHNPLLIKKKKSNKNQKVSFPSWFSKIQKPHRLDKNLGISLVEVKLLQKVITVSMNTEMCTV